MPRPFFFFECYYTPGEFREKNLSKKWYDIDALVFISRKTEIFTLNREWYE